MLEIRGVTRTYANGVRALAGVDLAIPHGLFGLLGPNGAGKSSLMRTIATLQAPDAGTIMLDGRSIFADPTGYRRRLGYLPQDFGVYPGVSALELLDHLALLKEVPAAARRAQVEALLVRTNLWAHRKQAVSGFSGGMRQRFGIAQALLGDPRVIVVDEPTAGLDPEERHRFHNLLSEIGEQVVVLLSTHIVDDVRQLCARMAILAEGRVLREGVPDLLIGELAGKVWTKTVAKDEVAAHEAQHLVLAAQLHAGRTRIRVLADARPGDGFEPAAPDLGDVYFRALADRRAA